MSNDTRDPIAEARMSDRYRSLYDYRWSDEWFDVMDVEVGGSVRRVSDEGYRQAVGRFNAKLVGALFDYARSLRTELERRKVPDTDLLAEKDEGLGVSIAAVKQACEEYDRRHGLPTRVTALNYIITELERLRGMEAAGKALIQRHGPKQHLDGCECAWCVLGRTLGGDE